MPTRWTSSRGRGLLASITLVVALLACLATSSPSAADNQLLTSDGGVRVLVQQAGNISLAALSSGPVTDVGGCLGMGDMVVDWPHGTTIVDEHPLTIHVPGLGDVVLGHRVNLGGGFVGSTGDDPDLPPGCRHRELWLGSV